MAERPAGRCRRRGRGGRGQYTGVRAVPAGAAAGRAVRRHRQRAAAAAPAQACHLARPAAARLSRLRGAPGRRPLHARRLRAVARAAGQPREPGRQHGGGARIRRVPDRLGVLRPRRAAQGRAAQCRGQRRFPHDGTARVAVAAGAHRLADPAGDAGRPARRHPPAGLRQPGEQGEGPDPAHHGRARRARRARRRGALRRRAGPLEQGAGRVVRRADLPATGDGRRLRQRDLAGRALRRGGTRADSRGRGAVAVARPAGAAAPRPRRGRRDAAARDRLRLPARPAAALPGRGRLLAPRFPARAQPARRDGPACRHADPAGRPRFLATGRHRRRRPPRV